MLGRVEQRFTHTPRHLHRPRASNTSGKIVPALPSRTETMLTLTREGEIDAAGFDQMLGSFDNWMRTADPPKSLEDRPHGMKRPAGAIEDEEPERNKRGRPPKKARPDSSHAKYITTTTQSTLIKHIRRAQEQQKI